MKRIKTWEQWGRIHDGFVFITGTRFPGDERFRALREPEFRKVMAVFNAAMKWQKLALGDNDIATMIEYAELARACERARK